MSGNIFDTFTDRSHSTGSQPEIGYYHPESGYISPMVQFGDKAVKTSFGEWINLGSEAGEADHDNKETGNV